MPTTAVVDDDNAIVPVKAMAKILTDAGYPTAASTLNKLRVRGGGPEYIKYGRAVGYRVGTAKAWARSRARVLRSTSDDGASVLQAA